ncbi:MAG: GAF domain-containing protein [Deltaproteobacteria bacterium]|nr:GAF domain-containing protein [Deltaproteobacteria bacterium]
MKWEVHVPDRAKAGQPATVTVEAENWKAALTAGLRALAESPGNSTAYTCEIREDGSVQVFDPSARRGFVLRDLDYKPRPAPTPPPEAVAAAAVRRSMLPPAPRASLAPSQPSAAPLLALPTLPPPASLSVPAPAPARAREPAPVAPSVPPPPEPVPEHQLFFSRTEEPESGSSLWYRERLVSVPPGTTREGINTLLMTYYNRLRGEAAGRPEAKYINVAVFDHAFSARAERPALGALTWKSWRSEVPEVSYPVDQPAMPLPVAVPVAAPAPAASVAAAAPSTAKAAVPAPSGKSVPPPAPEAKAAPAPRAPSSPPPAPVAVQQPMPAPAQTQAQAKAALSQTGRRRVPTPGDLAKLGREGAEEVVVNEILAQVFEEMMGLFNCRTRESAAEFALDVAMRRIPCEAGSVLLSDINSRDLVFTAVRGDAGHRLKGRKIQMGKGIVGFAARQGVAIAIADVRKDSRWNQDLDTETGFSTRSVIVAPIVHDGLTHGAFELLNRRGAEIFLQTETSIISYIATQLAEHLGTAVSSGGPDYFGEFEHAARPAAPGGGARRPPAPPLGRPGMTKKQVPVVAAKGGRGGKSRSR